MAEPKIVRFYSMNETRLELERDEDGEILLRIFDVHGEKVIADAYLDVGETLRAVAKLFSR